MTATEGTARWQAVEQVREALALHRSIGASGEYLTRRSDDALVDALAALSLLEQLAEAADRYLRKLSDPMCPPAIRQVCLDDFAEKVAAVRSGSASLTDGPHSGAGRAGA